MTKVGIPSAKEGWQKADVTMATVLKRMIEHDGHVGQLPNLLDEMEEMTMATHAGVTTEEFERVVTDRIATARHPKTGRLYKAGKPVGIHQHIGRRPIAAFGNSDGDLQMLEWTTAGAGTRFALIVHHTDARREWAYDRHSRIGKLDKSLDEAKARGWTVVSMKTDWNAIFPK